jgi:ATP-dependent Lhr-like helicase
VLLLTWRGDWVNDALALVIGRYGLNAANEGVAVRVYQPDMDRILDALGKIGAEEEMDPAALLSGVKNLIREKWDWALPEHLLRKSFASSLLDLRGAREVAASLSADIEAASRH